MKKLIGITMVVLMLSSCRTTDRLGGYKYPKQWGCVVGKVNYWKR